MEEKMKNLLFDEIYFQINHKELHNKTKSDRDHELKTIYEQKTGTSFSLETDDDQEKLYEWVKKQVRYPLLNDLIKSEIELLVDPQFALKLTNQPKEDQFVKNNLLTLLEIIRMQVADSLATLLLHEITTKPSKITKAQREEMITQILLELDSSGKWLMIYQNIQSQGKIIDLNECSTEEKERLYKELELRGESSPENACVRKKTSPDTYLLLSLEKTTEDILTIMHEFGHYLLHYFNPDEEPSLILQEFYPILFELFAKEYLKRWGISKEELFTIGSVRLTNTATCGNDCLPIYDYLDTYLKEETIGEERDIECQQSMITTHESMLKIIYGDQAAFFLPRTIAYQSCDGCIKKIISDALKLRQSFSYIVGHYLAKQGIENSQVLEKIKEYVEDIPNVDPYEIFKTVGCDVERIGLKPSIVVKEKSLGKKP